MILKITNKTFYNRPNRNFRIVYPLGTEFIIELNNKNFNIKIFNSFANFLINKKSIIYDDDFVNTMLCKSVDLKYCLLNYKHPIVNTELKEFFDYRISLKEKKLELIYNKERN